MRPHESSGGEALTAKTLSAAKWTYSSTVVTAALQVAVTAVLARMLTPEAFGLVAMAAVVLRFGQYFAQMGVGQAIVQRPELLDGHVAAGFWASTIIGGLFAAAVWLGAPLGSMLLDSTDLTLVLRWMSLSFVISGTSTTSFGILRRKMRFRAIALTEIAAYVIGYGGSLILAFLGVGVWALVFAGLAQATVASVVYNLIARPRLVPPLRWQPYRELLGFGTAVSAISFLEFLSSNLDTMLVGRLMGSTQLGYYSRALSLAGLPMRYMSTSLSRVLLPGFSRIQRDLPRAGRAYISLTAVFAGIGMPVALGMAGAANEVIGVMLGSQWAASVPVMRVVALAAVAAMLSHFGGILLEGTAHLREKAILRVGQFLVLGPMLIVMARYGLVGYATAFAASETANLIAQNMVLMRVATIGRRELVRAYTPGVVGGLAAAILLYGESRLGGLLQMSLASTLLVQILTGGAILVAASLFVQKGLVYRVLRNRAGRFGSPRIERLLTLADRVVGIACLDGVSLR